MGGRVRRAVPPHPILARMFRSGLPALLLCAIAAALCSACIFGSEARRDLSEHFPDQQAGQEAGEQAGAPPAPRQAAPEAAAASAPRPGSAAPRHYLDDLDGPPATPLIAVQRFFHFIAEEEYERAWNGITMESRNVVGLEAFAQRYRDIAAEATIRGMSWEVDWRGDDQAREYEVALRYHTNFYGEIAETVRARVLLQREYVVHWTPDLIFDRLNGAGFLIRNTIEAPRRGRIIDRNGVALAEDRNVAIVGLYRDAIDGAEAEEVVEFFTTRLQVDEEFIRERLGSTAPTSQFLPVATLPIDTPQVLIDEYQTLSDIGVLLQFEPRRWYPFGDAAAHVIGYLQEINAAELEIRADDGYRAGDLIGRDGIEQHWNDTLAGRRGGRLVIIDPTGWPVRVIAEREALPGSDVRLTLDIRAQQLAEQSLGDQPGAVAGIDPRTGHVIALASYPRVDLNEIVDGFTQAEADRYFNDDRQPFVNRAASQVYAPGSTFKPFSLAAALEHGGFAIDDAVDCPAIWRGPGGSELRNWKDEDQGDISLSRGLAESCNTVFYLLGLELDRLDPELLSELIAGFGYGSPTGIVGLYEEAGVNPSPSWKLSRLGERWYTGDTVNMSIGQGFVAVTVLQQANAYSGLAVGEIGAPQLVMAVEPPGREATILARPPTRPLPISEETLAGIRRGMREVISQPYGTGYHKFRGTTLKVAGKSGTAEDQVIDVRTIASVEADDEGGGTALRSRAVAAEAYSTHAWFAGWADFENPRLVVAVVLDDGASGSDNAGPIVRNVLEGALINNWVP